MWAQVPTDSSSRSWVPWQYSCLVWVLGSERGSPAALSTSTALRPVVSFQCYFQYCIHPAHSSFCKYLLALGFVLSIISHVAIDMQHPIGEMKWATDLNRSGYKMSEFFINAEEAGKRKGANCFSGAFLVTDNVWSGFRSCRRCLLGAEEKGELEEPGHQFPLAACEDQC